MMNNPEVDIKCELRTTRADTSAVLRRGRTPLAVFATFLSLSATDLLADPQDPQPGDPQMHQLQIQTQALAAITTAAEKMCTTPPLEQSSHKVELSGDAKATLAGVLAKVTDIGIQGAAKYTGGESKGILQDQLADAIKKGDDCKLEVLKTLRTMIPGLAP